jgi:hypothetical protein
LRIGEARAYFSTFAPLAIGFALCYCAYSIFVIRRIIGRVSKNADRLRTENPDSKPVTVASIRLRRAGLVGLWLYLARKSAKVFGRSHTQSILRQAVGLVVLSGTVCYVAAVFLLPAIATAWVYFDAPVDDGKYWWMIAILFGAAALVISVVVTLVLRYLEEYIKESGASSLSERYRWYIQRASKAVTRWLKDDEEQWTKSASQGGR